MYENEIVNNLCNDASSHESIKMLRIQDNAYDSMRYNVKYRKQGYWIYPITKSTIDKHAYIDIVIDGVRKPCLCDTGCTRLCATSATAQALYGPKWRNKLKPCTVPPTRDASNNIVDILGVITVLIELPDHLSVECPLLIYQSEQQDILLGYEALKQLALGVYPGLGIVNHMVPIVPQDTDMIKVLMNDIYSFPVHAVTNDIVPPYSTKLVTAQVQFPQEFGEEAKKKFIGKDILVSSENLEPNSPLDKLFAAHIYEVLTPDYECQVLIDNADGPMTLYINQNEILAEAEFTQIISARDEATSPPPMPVDEQIDKLLTDANPYYVPRKNQEQVFRFMQQYTKNKGHKEYCPEYREPDKNDPYHDQHYKRDLLQKGCPYQDEQDIEIKTVQGEYQYATEQTTSKYTLSLIHI